MFQNFILNATDTPSDIMRSGIHFETVAVMLYLEPSAPFIILR